MKSPISIALSQYSIAFFVGESQSINVYIYKHHDSPKYSHEFGHIIQFFHFDFPLTYPLKRIPTGLSQPLISLIGTTQIKMDESISRTFAGRI